MDNDANRKNEQTELAPEEIENATGGIGQFDLFCDKCYKVFRNAKSLKAHRAVCDIHDDKEEKPSQILTYDARL